MSTEDKSEFKWKCLSCPYVYEDFKGVGIHRIPLSCPECGGKIRGKREQVEMSKVQILDE